MIEEGQRHPSEAVSYTKEQRVRDEMLVRTGITNRTFGERQRRTCYREIWPAHGCALCRWMWACIDQEEH